MTDLQVHQENTNRFVSIFQSTTEFNDAQRICKMLTSSTIVPKAYQGEANLGNVLVAYDISKQMEMSVFSVMNNLDIIQGKTSWSAKFLISAINSSGKFKQSLQYKMEDLGIKTVNYVEYTGYGQNRVGHKKSIEVNDYSCYAYTFNHNKELIKGPIVSVETAVKEGWYTKEGSKWPTMMELMIQYRAGAFFSRVHTPEIGLGMLTTEETRDIEYIDIEAPKQKIIESTPTPVLSFANRETTTVDPKPIVNKKLEPKTTKVDQTDSDLL